jgi:hypothetical protein
MPSVLASQATGLEFPGELAAFRRFSVQDYESKHRGLGFSYGYRNEVGYTATVYLYTNDVPEVPTKVTDPAVSKLRAQTIEEIRKYSADRRETARHTAAEMLNVETYRGAVPVLFDAFSIDSPTNPRTSLLWLWTARGHFIKIRMSGNAQALEQSLVKPFYEAVVRLTTE